MARKFSARDIELIGYRHIKLVGDHPGGIHLTGRLDAGLSSAEHNFIYLNADCTLEQIASISKSLSSTSKVYVLLAPSHKLTEQSVRSAFGTKIADVLEVEDAIWKSLSSLFENYLRVLLERIPDEPFFVAARKEQHSTAELDKELVAYLSGQGDISPGVLAVVSAPAGVGKTTVARRASRMLARSVSNARAIPIFVEASHWRKFNLEANMELWDIIRNSIDHFGGPVGISEDLFEHGLRQGYFVFVFDGFDELCGPKHSQFSAIDVLRTLAQLAKQSDARILITTRTLFWQNEIEKIGAPENTEVLVLAPFNKAQAHGYLTERFKTDLRKRSQAQTLYGNLVQGSDLPENEDGAARSKFANLPLVVGMLADYVDQGGVDFQSHGHLIEDLLVQLCLRDKARQDLLANAREQLKCFEEIAVGWHVAVNPEFDQTTLELAGFPKEDVGDIKHHALVAPGRTPGFYAFRWDFLAPFLRALFLKRAILSPETGLDEQARKIMRSEANGKGFVFEHLCGLLDSRELANVGRTYISVPVIDGEARSFLVHIILALIDDDKSSYRNDEERTKAFFSILDEQSPRSIEYLTLIGQIERIDFRGITFKSCTFRDTSFVNCDVSENTIFDSCTFSGMLELNPPDNWGAVQILSNCIVRSPASLTLDSASSAKLTDMDDLLMDAMRLGLSKFWHNGSPRDMLKRDDWRKGLLGKTKYNEPLLESLKKSRVVRDSEKGRYDDPYILFEKDCFADLQRFMDHRALTGKILDAFRRLKTIASGA